MCERVDEYQGWILDLSEGGARCVKEWMNIRGGYWIYVRGVLDV